MVHSIVWKFEKIWVSGTLIIIRKRTNERTDRHEDPYILSTLVERGIKKTPQKEPQNKAKYLVHWLKGLRDMVFNDAFNNILAISWSSVLLVEETGVPGENHRPDASHRHSLSHKVVSITPRLGGLRTHNFGDEKNVKYNYTIVKWNIVINKKKITGHCTVFCCIIC
jgi:hypothetical protein